MPKHKPNSKQLRRAMKEENQRVEKQQRKKQRKHFKHGVAKGMKGYQRHFIEFQEQVKKLGLILKDVDGDGNCMFRSISDFLFGTEKKHFKLREIAVKEMRENSEFYGLFIEDDQTFEQYLKEMSDEGEWGGHLELQALASSLNVNFIIHMKKRPAMILTSMKDGSSRKEQLQKKQTIHLAYHLVEDIAEHYSSIRLENDLDNEEPAKPIPLSIFGTSVDQLQDYSEEQADQQNEDFSQESQFDLNQDEEKEYDYEDMILQQQIAEIEAAERNKNQKQKQEEKKQSEKQKKRIKQEVKEETKETQVVEGLNKKCPCGSKQVFKKCCYKKQQEEKQKQLALAKQTEDSTKLLFI